MSLCKLRDLGIITNDCKILNHEHLPLCNVKYIIRRALDIIGGSDVTICMYLDANKPIYGGMMKNYNDLVIYQIVSAYIKK